MVELIMMEADKKYKYQQESSFDTPVIVVLQNRKWSFGLICEQGLSKLLCKFLAPWKGRVLCVCPELALTHFEMKTSITAAVRESGDGIQMGMQGICFF